MMRLQNDYARLQGRLLLLIVFFFFPPVLFVCFGEWYGTDSITAVVKISSVSPEGASDKMSFTFEMIFVIYYNESEIDLIIKNAT